MSKDPSYLADRLWAEGQKVLGFFRRVPPDLQNLLVYKSGLSWNVLEILAHFVATEQALIELIDDIRKGGQGAPENFDIEKFNESSVDKLRKLSFEALITRFEVVRLQNCELIRELSSEELELQGRHPFLGIVPLIEIIKLLYLHNQLHIRDIRKNLPTSSFEK